MRLATFATRDGAVLAGDVRGAEVIAYTGRRSVPDLLGLADRPAADGRRFALDEITLLAPYVPRLVAGVGLNYARHAAEGSSPLPDVPMIFLKGPASVTAPGGPVIRPVGVRKLDYEGELAFIAGRGRSVVGYAIANDVSARDFREPTLVRQKAGDTFCPWGPWVTTADEIADPYALTLRTWVNGELRQEASTAEIIFRAGEILDALSRTIRVQPGDLVLTGTPAGVGLLFDPPRLLSPGDVVRIEIDELGAIEHRIVDEAAGDA